jgi:hypothetical protein
MEAIVILAVFVAIAIVLLKGFDKISGRHRADDNEERVPCPMCAEMILPQAKICRFCKSSVKD